MSARETVRDLCDPAYTPRSYRDCKHGQSARQCETCALEAENRTLRNVGVVLQERVEMALDFLDRYVTSGDVTRAQANQLRALLRQSSSDEGAKR